MQRWIMVYTPFIAAIVISWAGAFGIAWGVTEWTHRDHTEAGTLLDEYRAIREIRCEGALDLRIAVIAGIDSLSNAGWVHFMEQVEADISEFC